MRLCIRGARIGTSKADFTGDVLIDGEKIVRVVQGSLSEQECAGAEIIDAHGLILIPGGVDVHTHFDLDVGFTRASDDFYTGSIAAACGGTTTIVDHMAFGPKGCDIFHQAEVYHKLAEAAVIDYGFHGVLQHVDDNILSDMEQLLKNDGISSYKVYMTYDYMLNDGDLFRVLERAKELNLVICAHCENDGLIKTLRNRFDAAGCKSPKYHPVSRPVEAEAEAVFRFLMLAHAAGSPDVHVVHLSSSLGLIALRAARNTGQQRIWAETCPQYLLLDDNRYIDGLDGLRHIMCPPLRSQEDSGNLWQAVEQDEIDVIATDHCPFLDSQKIRGSDNFMLAPSGAPGVELRMPLMFSEGFMSGRVTLSQLVRLCCTKPAEIFGLAPRKGDIIEGADADITLFDPSKDWVVTKEKLHENIDYTPYEGMLLHGFPVLTLSRGIAVARNGHFIGKKGYGQYLRRERN